MNGQSGGAAALDCRKPEMVAESIMSVGSAVKEEKSTTTSAEEGVAASDVPHKPSPLNPLALPPTIPL